MNQLKKCPFCWEDVLLEAIKCKHCWEFFEKQEQVEKKEKKYLNFSYSFNHEISRKNFIEYLEKKYNLENVQINNRTWSETSWWGTLFGDVVDKVRSQTYYQYDISFSIALWDKIKVDKNYIDLIYQFYNLTYSWEVGWFLHNFYYFIIILFISYVWFKLMLLWFLPRNPLLILIYILICYIINKVYTKIILNHRKRNINQEQQNILNQIKNYQFDENKFNF